MVGCIHLFLVIASYILGFGITYIHCIKKVKGKSSKAKDKPQLSDREKGGVKKKPENKKGNKANPPKASPNKFKFDTMPNHPTAGPETELKSDADANLLGKTIIRDKILKPKALPPAVRSDAPVREPVKPKSGSVYGANDIPPEIRSVPVPSKQGAANPVKPK